jgi:DNA transformation protein
MQDDSFKDLIVDQLEKLDDLRVRQMFGGFGLYLGRKFFGIVSKGQLYFKTDGLSRKKYLKYGMKPFRPTEKQTLKNYYEVPLEIIEDRRGLTRWAQEAAKLSK